MNRYDKNMKGMRERERGKERGEEGKKNFGRAQNRDLVLRINEFLIIEGRGG